MHNSTKRREPKAPTDCGKRLLPIVLDERCASGYARPIVSLPRSNDPKDGFQDISYQTFGNAVNRCCWLLDESLGTAQDFSTIAYIGPSDVRYLVLYFAAMKTCRKVFMPSPRNSLADQLILLEKVHCQTILVPETPSPMVVDILEKSQIDSLPLPSVKDLFDEAIVKHYNFNKSYEEAKLDPFAILHTSGSTGTPKPITIRHIWTSQLDKYQDYTTFGFGAGQSALTRERRIFMAFPMFHSAGVLYGLNANIWYESTNVFAPPVPLTAEVANAMHVHANVDVTAVVPSVIMDLAKTSAYFENLERLEALIFAGGPISTSVGSKITSKTYLFNSIGSTECGLWNPEIKDDPADWEYFKFNEFCGFHFQEVSPGMFEAIIVQDPKLDPAQAVFHTLPDLDGQYRTKDLYSQHPSKPSLWKYEGRADDIIVFTNGEKVNPVSMEHLITTHPDVNAALVVGQARFRPALLVEPTKNPYDAGEEDRLLEKLKPVLQQANRETVAHGRISKDYVIVASEDKPFLRAGKGTIQRQLTLEMYKEEIEQLYENDGRGNVRSVGTFESQEEMELYILNLVQELTDFANLYNDTDLFQRGMDSLQVINLVAEINALFGTKRVSNSSIYNNPTVSKISYILWHGETEISAESHQDNMRSILETYGSGIPSRSVAAEVLSSVVVIVTGTTGSLGSYLLKYLLQSNSVAKVYCLNRSQDARARQEKLWGSYDLDLASERVEFLQTDFSRPMFGLDPSVYKQLSTEVTHIIHNAWAVDFNIPVSSFVNTHINGVRQLIDFSIQSKSNAHIFFISTISAVFNWKFTLPVPESFLDDWTLPESMGYAESKFVSERLLERANTDGGVACTVCRVGQIAGPVLSGTNGVWNKQEWLPSIIASSKYMGKIPGDIGPMNTVDWIPVDRLAQVIVELLCDPGDQANNSNAGDAVYHATNPNHSSWTDLLPAILSHFDKNDKPEIVSYEDWVVNLRSSVENGNGNPQQNPAMKLLSFFEENVERAQANTGEETRWPTLGTVNTCAKSATLKNLEAVSPQWMELWMRQWQF